MATVSTLKIVKPKKEWEKIVCIETPPKPEWFVSTREQGRTVWYLRFTLTGMWPRRFGPFQSRRQALLALDSMLGAMTDAISETQNMAREYQLQRRFQQTWGPVIEDELALAREGR